MHKQLQKTGKILVTLVKEPLLQFLVIGMLIFVAAHIVTGWQQQRQQVIVVDDGLIRHLENLYNVQFGIYPDKKTLDQLVHNYIREEALYREALKLGLANQDEIIRRRLVQKMEYLLADSKENELRGDEVLKAYYRRHMQDFMLPATVSFQHLYFSDDNNGDSDARQRAAHALQMIRAGGIQRARTGADPFPLQNSYNGLNRRAAEQLFGHTELVRKLFEIPDGQWSGPYQSGYGWHLLRVNHRYPGRQQPFSAVKNQVLSAWQAENHKLQLEEGVRNILKHYRVRRNVGAIGND